MDIFEELGVTAYINANEWYTSQGGSMPAAPVIEAMQAAGQRAVRLVELQDAVGRHIADLTRNEAACVTGSATSGIVLAVAAFMCGLDAARSESLPFTRGLKTEVIIQKCDRFGEDAAIRIPGARIVEIGGREGATEQDLTARITPATAAVFTTAPRDGMIPIESLVRTCREHDVGLIVDIAWALPPKENLWRYTRDAGADVVIVSGGKGLRGPQASGLILGRRAVVDACRDMMAPHCRIGRPAKVGREAAVGIYAAVKHFLNGGAEEPERMARYIVTQLADVDTISVRHDQERSHLHIQLLPSRSRLTRDEVKAQLLAEHPRILVRDSGTNGIRVNASTLSEGHELVVAARLRAVLAQSADR